MDKTVSAKELIDVVPEDFSVIDADDAVARLVENWVDDGGEVGGFMTESCGPWG